MTSLERTLPRPGDWVMWVSLSSSFWCWTHKAEMRLSVSAGTAGIFRPTELRSRNNQQMRKLLLKEETRFHSLIHSDTGKVYACVYGGSISSSHENEKEIFDRSWQPFRYHETVNWDMFHTTTLEYGLPRIWVIWVICLPFLYTIQYAQIPSGRCRLAQSAGRFCSPLIVWELVTGEFWAPS